MRHETGRWGAVLLLLMAIPSLAGADAGSVLKVDGQADLVRGGQRIPLEQGGAVRSGDHIETTPQSKVQARFKDDSFLLVADQSVFEVNDYAYQGRRSKAPNRTAYSLIRGAFRTVTGLIGKNKQDTYQVKTSTATIGIRGTDYAAILCEDNCAKPSGERYPNGVYIKSFTGAVVIVNAGGEIVINSNRVAYANSSATAAVLVSESPFDDPLTVERLRFTIDIELELFRDPPRIEPPASPS